METIARKAIAFVICRVTGQAAQLLVYRWQDWTDDSLWRVPGGNLEADETPEAAIVRELREEVGDYPFEIVRLLGVQRYFKAYIGREVERYDFLLRASEYLPENFQRADPTVPAGEPNVMELRWISASELHLLDPEHRNAVTEHYLPEFFER